MTLAKIAKKLPSEDSLHTLPRPYFNHSVEFKERNSAEKRLEVLKEVGYNVFFFPAGMITGCDFLSDSGTTTMTNKQWAALHLGDESYGSNKGYFLLMEKIREVFGNEFFNEPALGKPNAFIFHQGRPCEDALFSMLGKTGKKLIIPSNGHFDTTEANIHANKIKPLNLFSEEFKSDDSESHFKGNMNIKKLKDLLKKSKNNIPLIYITITNNTGGGQPVSMENIKQVSSIAKDHKIPLFFDACRFAENAWFIKKFEKGYKSKSISKIVKEMFSYVDGFTISFKKDGLVNMGGGLFLRAGGLFIKNYPEIPDALMNHQIIKEGHPTYGGLSGRDIMTLVTGLGTIIQQKYLDHRIRQVRELGEKLVDFGIPMVTPFGGHAVYMDVNKFFEGTNMKPNDFGGISFTAALLGLYGHRACELGYFAFGQYDPKTKKEKHPEVNFVRFAVPRLRYERQDLESTAEAVKNLYENRELLPKVKVAYGRDLPLRHFKARFELH
ncbi:tryptophanase [Candidatus Dojkabacteria bacterium]|nr:tryptophanase [Candidatus Dojkabacteria bacterium]